MEKKKNRVDRFKKSGVAPAVLTTISVLSGLTSIFIVVYMMSLLWDGAETGTIILLGIAVCVCQMSKAVFYACALWKSHDFAYSGLFEIRIALIEHLKKLSFAFFQKKKAGDLANIIDRDVERIELYLAHTLPDVLITNIVCFVIFLIVTVLDWRLGIALISSVPFVFVFLPLFGKIWNKSVKNYQESIKIVSENVIEYISSIPAIKTFSSDETKTENVLKSMRDYIKKAKKAIYSQLFSMSFITLLMEAGVVVVAITGSIILKRNSISAWRIIVFILAVILAGQFSKNFSKSMSLQYNKIVYKNTMNTVNTIFNEKVNEENERTARPGTGDIQFHNVDFGYKPDEKVLKDITVNFQQNSVNAIAGPSGAGKSTITNLIMGFWKPDKGTITIGGKNIREFHEQDISALISIVQQDTFLFDGSIEENIKIGKESASPEEITGAAKKARIHDTIMSLPSGYQTLAGEAGARLSGGEKQRISLARMFLKNAPIVILDEAAVGIDPSNEYLLQQAIGDLCKDKTLVIIDHRLKNITYADKIVVMEDGKVIAQGTHKTLMKDCAVYKTIYDAEKKAEYWNMRSLS
jgi:ATP-binding cassette subfamily B protein